MQIQPRYTSNNCSAAYQLNWSLSVFGRESLPSPASSIEQLREAIAKDHLKILEFNHKPPNIVQYFVSSRSDLNPSDIVRLIKGRWQYLMRSKESIEFRRNYRITSVGSANADVLDAYIDLSYGAVMSYGATCHTVPPTQLFPICSMVRSYNHTNSLVIGRTERWPSRATLRIIAPLAS